MKTAAARRENWFDGRDGKPSAGALVVEDIFVDLFGNPGRVLFGPFFSWKDAEAACGVSETAEIVYVNPPAKKKKKRAEA